MKIPGQYQHFTLCSMPIVCDDISNKVLPSQSGWWHRVKGIGDPADHQLQPISVTGALFASLWFIYKRNCLLIMGLLHLNSLPPSLPYSLPLPPPSPLSLSLSLSNFYNSGSPFSLSLFSAIPPVPCPLIPAPLNPSGSIIFYRLYRSETRKAMQW